jgi:plasmid stabilization system protein ParE
MGRGESDAPPPGVGRRVLVRATARADIDEAFRWYESRSPGLGSEFVRAIDACVALIERYPESHAEVYRQTRRTLLRRFPYAVFYVIQSETIEIVACFHVRRDPRRWRERM